MHQIGIVLIILAQFVEKPISPMNWLSIFVKIQLFIYV